jgi:hypothetical protein
MTATIALSSALIDQHVRSAFAGSQFSERRWTQGPSVEEFPDLYVLHATPRKGSTLHVFSTVGASNVRSGYHREFLVLANDAGDHHVETLFMVTYYHAHEGLDVGHTCPIGHGWRPGASCDHLLFSRPYAMDPKFEYLHIGRHEVRFLWALPVYASEVQYRHSHGLEALEKLFDAAKFDLSDEHRSAVI